MDPVDIQIERLMERLFAPATEEPRDADMAVILEFMGLRPPYRLDLRAGDTLDAEDPRRKVFKAQLTYILNTGGLMFILMPLPLKSVHTGTGGESITMGSCTVRAVHFQYGRWFPVPADQIATLFRPPDTDRRTTHWLFRNFADR
jgi:hypothetical protein